MLAGHGHQYATKTPLNIAFNNAVQLHVGYVIGLHDYTE